jgi:WD40 repeat protein
VKCLTATSLNGKRILISGGADAAIVVWNVETGKQLYKLKGHTKALQDLAIDPLSIPEGTTEPGDTFTLFSASSDREIRRWHISLDSAYELPESVESTILAHDTSVYKLYFDSEGDLWTASADKTAKHLVRSRGWEADTVLQHPDFVRDVAISERLGLVVTACRDEEVRVWDAASGDLMCAYSGHYEEVTGLIVVGSMVVSVSIDGTLRKWGLGKDAMENYRKEIEDVEKGEEKESVKDGATGGMLTAEEEAELADLMDDDTD